MRRFAVVALAAAAAGCATTSDCPYSDCHPRYGYWGVRSYGYYGPYWDPYPYYGPRYGSSLWIGGGSRFVPPSSPPPSPGLVTPPDARRTLPRPVAPPVLLPPAGLPGGSPPAIMPPAPPSGRAIGPPGAPGGPRRLPPRP